MAFKVPLGTLGIKITGDDGSFSAAMKRTRASLKKSVSAFRSAGIAMSAALTAPIAAAGAASLKSFASFDDAMTKSTAIMGNLSAETRQAMRDVALELSQKGTQSATELAESYFFLASAGLNAQQSMKALPAVQAFATAGAFDMATATDLLTDAQSALGLTSKDAAQNLKNMKRVSDVLVIANTQANASVEQFSKALTAGSATAFKNAGKGIEELTALLAVYADKGVKGEKASEQATIALRDLQAASLKNAKVWKAMGLSVFDTTGKIRPVADIVEDLTGRFSKMSDQQKKSAATLLGFQDRSFKSIQTLLGTSKQIRKIEEAFKANNVTQSVAEKQLRSFSSQMKILRNRIEAAGIGIGGTLAPAVAKLGDHIQSALNWWNGLSQSAREALVWITAAVAAMGPLVVMVTTLATRTTLVVAGLALIAAAIVAVSDAIGVTNTGFLDLLESFRLGGAKISTWFQAAWTEADRGFNFFKTGMQQGIEFLMIKVRNFGITLNSTLSKAFGLIKKLPFMGDVGEGAQKAAAANVSALAMDNAAASARIAQLQAQGDRRDRFLKNQMLSIFDKDTREQQRKAGRDTSAADAAKKAAELADKIAKQAAAQTGARIPGVAARSSASFQQLSQRRFSLEGLSRFGQKKEEKVKDEGANKLLQELVAVTKKKEARVG